MKSNIHEISCVDRPKRPIPAITSTIADRILEICYRSIFFNQIGVLVLVFAEGFYLSSIQRLNNIYCFTIRLTVLTSAYRDQLQLLVCAPPDGFP